MARTTTRRDFVRRLGIGGAALPFILNLPSLGFANQSTRKQRLIVMFSPNGIFPDNFWPDQQGEEFELKPILKPLEPFKDQLLVLNGVCDKVRGDGDNHMRGIGCLLTGTELFPGNIQGGSDTPAGWASGLSIDQEIKNFLQSNDATRTRFGSLEFGVMVPDRADAWTRMSYAGPNKPLAPIDDPYQMFNKLYGRQKDQESLKSILDELQADLGKVRSSVAPRTVGCWTSTPPSSARWSSSSLPATELRTSAMPCPSWNWGWTRLRTTTCLGSRSSRSSCLCNSFAADFARVATFQITNSVGQPKMRWIGIDEGHHELSHEPDSNEDAVDKLTRINTWYCEQMAYLAKRLAETPEPGGPGSLLDNTTIVWTNELGKGNSHTLNNIPFIMVGGGLGFRMGRSLKYDNAYHNRLLLSMAHSFGHTIDRFGNPDYCGDGPLHDLT